MDILQFIMDGEDKQTFSPPFVSAEEKHIQYLKRKRIRVGDKAVKKKYPWMDDLREFNKHTYDR